MSKAKTTRDNTSAILAENGNRHQCFGGGWLIGDWLIGKLLQRQRTEQLSQLRGLLYFLRLNALSAEAWVGANHIGCIFRENLHPDMIFYPGDMKISEILCNFANEEPRDAGGASEEGKHRGIGWFGKITYERRH